MARIDLNLELAMPGDIAREAVASLRDELGNARIQIVDGGAAPIPMDRRLVRLALKQLVDNAMKYSPPETPITIRVDRRHGKWSTLGPA